MQTFFNLMHCGLQSVNAVFKGSECNLLIFSSKAQVKRKKQNPSNQDAQKFQKIPKESKRFQNKSKRFQKDSKRFQKIPKRVQRF